MRKTREETKKNQQLTAEELEAKKSKEDKAVSLASLRNCSGICGDFSGCIYELLPYALASLIRKVGASEVLVTIAEAFVKMALFMGHMLLISG